MTPSQDTTDHPVVPYRLEKPKSRWLTWYVILVAGSLPLVFWVGHESLQLTWIEVGLTVYWFIWIYQVHAEVLSHVEGKYSVSAAKAVILCFVPIFNIYWLAAMPYRLAKRIEEMSAADNLATRIEPRAVLICQIVGLFFLWLPGVHLVFWGIAMLHLQGALNKYWQHAYEDAAGAGEAKISAPQPMARWAVALISAAAAIPYLLGLQAILPESQRDRLRRQACIFNLHQIGCAIVFYTEKHSGAFPSSLEAMGQEYYERRVLSCPGAKDRYTIGYEYLGSGIKSEDLIKEKARVIIAFDKMGNHRGRGRNVLFLGGSGGQIDLEVKWMKEKDFQRYLEVGNNLISRYEVKR